MPSGRRDARSAARYHAWSCILRRRTLESPNLANPDRHAFTIEIFQQRNRVLAGGLVAVAKLTGRDALVCGQIRHELGPDSIDALRMEVQIRRHTHQRSLPLHQPHQLGELASIESERI